MQKKNVIVWTAWNRTFPGTLSPLDLYVFFSLEILQTFHFSGFKDIYFKNYVDVCVH